MIIGSGDIASALKDNPSFTYFAAGVSNSGLNDYNEYHREVTRIHKIEIDKHLVYFSSLSIYYADTFYTRHKLAMEKIVKDRFEGNTIIRIGNITWGKNPHTLINYLKYCIENNLPYEVKDVYRFLLSKEDFLFWIEKMNYHPTSEMNITGEKLKVAEIVERIKRGIL